MTTPGWRCLRSTLELCNNLFTNKSCFQKKSAVGKTVILLKRGWVPVLVLPTRAALREVSSTRPILFD